MNPQEIEGVATHLRDVLGDADDESLAQAGARMTDSAKAKYALEQIDHARTALVQIDGSS